MYKFNHIQLKLLAYKGSSIYDVHKKLPIFWSPYPHHPQKWTIDLLFKNNRIRKHVTNLKTPSPPFRVDIINVWSLTRDTCYLHWALIKFFQSILLGTTWVMLLFEKVWLGRGLHVRIITLTNGRWLDNYIDAKISCHVTQQTLTCSKLTIETL